MDMLNAVKSMLADVSSVGPSSEQRQRANARNVSQQTPAFGVQHIHINLTLIHCTFLPPRRRRPKLVLTGTSIPLYPVDMLRINHIIIIIIIIGKNYAHEIYKEMMGEEDYNKKMEEANKVCTIHLY